MKCIKRLLIFVLSISFQTNVYASCFETTIEAEYTILNGSYEIKTGAEASGGIHIKSNPGASFTFEIDAPEAGAYNLDIFNFNNGVTDHEVSISVNGGIASNLFLAASNWASLPAQSVSTSLNLSQGTNSIVITTTVKAVWLDKLVVSQTTPCINVGESIEAESTVLSGTYTIQNTGLTNASNNAYVDLETTGTSEFAVTNVAVAGTYSLRIYYFNNIVSQDVNLTVNGGSSTVLLDPSNLEVNGPAQYVEVDVNLNAGYNTITLERLNYDVSLDFLSVLNKSNTYYISTSGSGINDGLSPETPWDLAQLNTAFETDINGGFITAGSNILFKRGEEFYDQLIIKRSGTNGNPIVLSSYGSLEEDLPIISGSGGTITGGDYIHAVHIEDVSYLTVSNLWIKNDRQAVGAINEKKDSNNSRGIYVKANNIVSTNLTFTDLKISDVLPVTFPASFSGYKVAGIMMESEPFVEDEGIITDLIGFQDIVIKDSYFTNIGKAGVWVKHAGAHDDNDFTINRNQNITVKDNHFFETGGSGAIISKSMNVLVENNDFDHTGHSDVSEPRLAGRGSGLWVFRCKNVIAQYNRSYSVRGSGDSYGMHIDFGNTDVIYQYNYSEDSEGGFVEILGENSYCTYRFNVSVNDGFRDNKGNSIWVSDFAGTGNQINSDNCYVYNNTIYLDTNYTPDVSIIGDKVYVYNNVFMANNGEIGQTTTVDPGTQLFLSNNLHNGTISVDLTNLGSNWVGGSPEFHIPGAKNIHGYYLTETSAAIDAGIAFTEPSFPAFETGIFSHITEFSSKDIFGNSIDIANKIPNIGASNAFNSNVLNIPTYQEKYSLFNVHPNPVKEEINIQLNEILEQPILQVLDITGKQVFISTSDRVVNQYQISLPSNIKNGIYFLKITDKNKSQAEQIILFR